MEFIFNMICSINQSDGLFVGDGLIVVCGQQTERHLPVVGLAASSVQQCLLRLPRNDGVDLKLANAKVGSVREAVEAFFLHQYIHKEFANRQQLALIPSMKKRKN